ncbi:MAG: hypothetical protein LBS43_10270 [Prevotellaceae bacterium]|jgi:hypothetical protein|nr:hypothetical protein [Prevotellaceae bacterium]
MKTFIFIVLWIVSINLSAQNAIKKAKFTTFPIPVTYIQYPSKPLGGDYETYNIVVNMKPYIPAVASFIRENIHIAGFELAGEETDLTVTSAIEFFFRDHTVEEHNVQDKKGNITAKEYILKLSYAYTINCSLTDNHNGKSLYSESYKKGSPEYSERMNTDERWYKVYSDQNSLRSAISSIEKIKTQIIQDIIKNKCDDLSRTCGLEYGTQVMRNIPDFIRLNESDFYEHYFYLKYINDLKIIMEKMSIDYGIEQFMPDLKLIIDYFESLVSRYETTPIGATMAAASYYNIGLIYYYLDMPEQTLLYAQKIFDRGDKNRGKSLKDQALQLQHIFKVNNKTSRH